MRLECNEEGAGGGKRRGQRGGSDDEAVCGEVCPVRALGVVGNLGQALPHLGSLDPVSLDQLRAGGRFQQNAFINHFRTQRPGEISRVTIFSLLA